MKYYVTINDKRYEVDVEKGKAAILSTTEISSGIIQPVTAVTPTPVSTPTPVTPEVPVAIPIVATAIPIIAGEVVKAPMPGGILDIKVNVGSVVKKGDTLLVLEAMKMENEISSPRDGVVAQILVTRGSAVAINDTLVVIS